MKRYRRVWTVYRKELIETLRDRRTLLAMVFVPIILYPVLMVVLVEALKSEAGRQEEERYSICVPDEAHKVWLERMFAREESQRVRDAEAAEQAAKALGEDSEDMASAFITELNADQIHIEVAGPDRPLWDLVADQSFHAAVIIEPAPAGDDSAGAVSRIVQILYSDTNPLSEVIYRQLNRMLAREADRIIEERVLALTGGEDILMPLRADNLSTTSPDRQFAKVLAMIVPFLLVTMTVTGAIYPAIDLTAGERERGTLETLAVSPVPVGQIVAGKFGVIVTIAMATTALNLSSMTAVLHFSKLDKLFTASRAVGGDNELVVKERISAATGNDGRPSLQRDHLERRRRLEREAAETVGFVTTAAPIVLLCMVPFAVLFSGLMLAVCSFARTFKEAQNYMMPVMMAAIVPAMVVSYMPTIRLEGAMIVTPVVNVVLLMRELFLGNYDPTAMAVCLLSTCFYAAAAVAVANRIYGNEAVLFSDVGNYKTLILRRFIRPSTYPAASLALMTVAVIFPLNFYTQSSMIDAASPAARNRLVIVGTQLFLFAAPVILLAWYVKLDLKSTFSFRRPRLVHVAATVLLAAAIFPVSALFQQIQFSLFPPGQKTLELYEHQQELLFQGGSLWVILVVFAVMPGVCEEILFRGFLLAGIRGRLSTIKTAVVVGVIFGLYHIDFLKIPLVSALGILLAFICLRSGSILPAMLVHVANNAFALASAKVEWLRALMGLPGLDADPTAIHFELRTALFLGLFVAGLVLLVAARPRPSVAT